MFNLTFNKVFLSTVAAALVAAGLSVNPATAGEGGGGGKAGRFEPNAAALHNPKAPKHASSAQAARYFAMLHRVEAAQPPVAETSMRNSNSHR
ncbi:MAG: hypothetical protein AAF665_19815 [Pseudomonadota bacterium]